MSRLRESSGLRSVLLVALSACAPSAGPGPEAPNAPRAAERSDDPPGPAAERYEWQAVTRSPWPPAGPTSVPAAPCSIGDGALERVAARIAARELDGAPPLAIEEVTYALRAEGAPYVWPRLWTLRGLKAREHAAERLAAWLSEGRDAGHRRCAVAQRSSGELDAIAALSVGVLADFEPLPTEVEIGTWLDVRARLLDASATRAEVLVLGPRGAPRRVPSELADGRVRARFHADRAGAWLVQVLAHVEGGPRPVAEALVFAGEPPSPFFAARPAPGEEAEGGRDAAEDITSMLNLARRSEGLRELARDARLDRVAAEHAEAMRGLGRIAHDAGRGSPDERVQAAGIAATSVGENVARARTPKAAHRALWASPSHRKNLLDPAFDGVGIGVARSTDDSVWVVELFAKRGHTPSSDGR